MRFSSPVVSTTGLVHAQVGLNISLNGYRAALLKQLVICRSCGFTGARHVVVSTRCFCGLVRDGLKCPLDETCTNKYAHVVVVREHVWRTLCSVCATGARVAQSFLSNS